MSKEIFNWSELIEKNREKLEAAIRDAQMEALGIASGCFIAIELGKDGEIYMSGIMTPGSFSMDSYTGKTIVIYRAYGWEPELNYIDWLANDGQKVQEFLAQQEEGHEWAYDFMKEKYPEILAHWEKMARRKKWRHWTSIPLSTWRSRTSWKMRNTEG
jgi:hypothetical protein